MTILDDSDRTVVYVNAGDADPSDTKSVSTPGGFAREAIALGWDPIPLYGVDADGICMCDLGAACPNTSPGKHPTNNGWPDHPRISIQDTYTLWDTETEPRNVGLRTGTQSGFWALDIDPKNGGDEVLRTLEAAHGSLPPTRVHRTGSGGLHYLFTLPSDFVVGNSSGRIPSGIDVKGERGFIVGPGSVSGVGAYWVEVDAQIGAAPDWLLDLIRPKPVDPNIETVESVEFAALDPMSQESARVYTERAVELELSRLDALKRAATPNGIDYKGDPWNQTVYEVCCNLLEMVQTEWMPFEKDDFTKALNAHAPMDSGFTKTEILGCFRSASRKVAGKSRAMPATIMQDTWAMLTASLESTDSSGSRAESVDATWPEASWDQLGNVKRTLRHAAGRLVWVPETASWYECGTNGVWHPPVVSQRDDVAAKWCARAMAAAQTLEVDNYSDDKPKKTNSRGQEVEEDSKRMRFLKFMSESSKVEMHSAVATQLRRSAEDHGIQVNAARFDADPFMLACASGFIDLRTGAIRPITPSDLVSVSSPVEYDPSMPTPNFKYFLESSHPDPEVRDFLQKVLGYSLTGVTTEHKMFIHHGSTTANGKSVLINVISAILGAHFMPAPEKALLKQRSGTSRSGQDMVDLVGPRFLALNETNQGAALDGEIIKSLTSGDERSDRGHYSKNTKYRVTGKIHLLTNHLPHITADHAMDRRLAVIPWTQSFRDKPDPELGEKLKGELPGILAWLVEGSVRWYADLRSSGMTGLSEPALCRQAKEAYFEDEDEVGTWLKEACTPLDPSSSPTSWATAKDLYRSYDRWRVDQGLQNAPMSVNTFGRTLTSKGYESTQTRLGGTSVKVRPIRIRAAAAPFADPFS